MGVAEDEFFTLGVPEPGHRSEERTFQRDISQINEKYHTQTQIGLQRKPSEKNTKILPTKPIKMMTHLPNMEIIQLKMDVAKEREINACLRDEISSVKVNFKREIRLLQETIDIQNQVIDQLKVKNEMKDEVCDILETAQEEDSFEVDLSLEAEAWIIEAESFEGTEDMEDTEEDHDLDEDESTEAEEEASFVIAKENFFEDHEESLHDSLLDTSETFSDYESSVQTSNASISTPKISKAVSKAPKKTQKTQKTSSSYEDEGFKIVIELSKEIDALKTSLSSSEEDLLVYKVSL